MSPVILLVVIVLGVRLGIRSSQPQRSTYTPSPALIEWQARLDDYTAEIAAEADTKRAANDALLNAVREKLNRR